MRLAPVAAVIGILAIALQSLAGAWHAASHRHDEGATHVLAVNSHSHEGSHHSHPRTPTDDPSHDHSDCPTCIKFLASAKHLISGDLTPLPLDTAWQPNDRPFPESRVSVESARTTLARGPPAILLPAC